MNTKLYRFLVLVVLAVLSYGTYMALVTAPTEETMGDAQRIFYYHVPAAVTAYTMFFINFVASILYLWKRSRVADTLAHACAEVGLVFATVVLITGPIWAHFAWGSWWAWDMRLTTFLVLWLLYLSYLVLRQSAEPGTSSVLASALAVIAFLDVPFNYLANRLFSTIHPPPVTLTAPMMKITLSVNMLAFMAFGALIAWFRYELGKTEHSITKLHLKKAAGGAGFAVLLPALFLFQVSDSPLSEEMRTAHARSHMMGGYIATWAIYIGYLLVLAMRVRRLQQEGAELLGK
ncbi:MAG TPA: cytochrome c biogenesis protein CcsA [Candidatus Saccharimonadales bacterium]|jgi:heme exporter protein C|nr:cytochrome c biogenesis protein CcsA [Candidatus Saccharimonadales bacterium]